MQEKAGTRLKLHNKQSSLIEGRKEQDLHIRVWNVVYDVNATRQNVARTKKLFINVFKKYVKMHAVS